MNEIFAHRQDLVSARRIVIKIGSTVLASLDHGVDAASLQHLTAQVAGLHAEGREVVLVSSGAVAAGAAEFGMQSRPTELPHLQAAAAVGQGKLMHFYADAFARHNLTVGQMLLTRDGLDDRLRYLNARSTLNALLELGAVPIINENDTVMVEEIQFGDNDQLSAMAGIMAEADALVILSDVDGLHEKPPALGESPVIEYIPTITPEIEKLAGVSESGVSRGGMSSKLYAARRATAAGMNVVIAGGRTPDVLTGIFSGKAIGTCFAAGEGTVSAKKHWLAGRMPTGCIHVDSGAVRALEENGKSLLPIGMIRADENITVGDTVSIVNEEGTEFARGISNYAGSDLQRICRKQSDELADILGYTCTSTVIHRDNLVLLNQLHH